MGLFGRKEKIDENTPTFDDDFDLDSVNIETEKLVKQTKKDKSSFQEPTFDDDFLPETKKTESQQNVQNKPEIKPEISFYDLKGHLVYNEENKPMKYKIPHHIF